MTRHAAAPKKPQDRIALLLAQLWLQNLPLLEERLSLLDRAASALTATGLPASLRQDAAGTAHKLAGSLGLFGYTEATAIARRVECLLLATDAPSPGEMTQLTAALRQSLPQLR